MIAAAAGCVGLLPRRRTMAMCLSTLDRRKRGRPIDFPKDKHGTSFDPSKLDPSLISSMASCFEDASLSPYLPVPEAVAHKMLILANACSTDIHYELGSGDGRVNLHATTAPFRVAKSIGVEIDMRLIHESKERAGNRPNLQFIHADLMNPRHQVWRDMEEEATVITMYFVQTALIHICESLASIMKKRNCRVVTCGYPIPNWEPRQVDQHLGLSLYLYESRGDEGRENCIEKSRENG